jgi:hypothetical protein
VFGGVPEVSIDISEARHKRVAGPERGRIYAPGGRKKEEKRLTELSFQFIKPILLKTIHYQQGDLKGGQPQISTKTRRAE